VTAAQAIDMVAVVQVTDMEVLQVHVLDVQEIHYLTKKEAPVSAPPRINMEVTAAQAIDMVAVVQVTDMEAIDTVAVQVINMEQTTNFPHWVIVMVVVKVIDMVVAVQVINMEQTTNFPHWVGPVLRTNIRRLALEQVEIFRLV